MHGVPAQSVLPLCSLAFLLVIVSGAGCGSRTDTTRSIDGGGPLPSSAERCNGLDDDGANGVDDAFRDALGRYITDAHCGACNQPCAPRNAAELATQCTVVDEVPRCVAKACAPGFAVTREGRCEPLGERLCLSCANDNDCGALSGARCTDIAGEARCAIDCALGCPEGYQCDGAARVCKPVGGSCSCTATQDFELACAVQDATREPGSPVCVGRASCSAGVLSACATSVEVCDHDDNDCDGQVDEGFADARGAYSLDQDNCGECGVSCAEETGLELKLACGGDPFAPSCTLACPDALDGIVVGDMLDGDLDIGSGCECKVSALRDEPGPLRARDAALDVNCDGADGEVLSSFYVATDGNDAWPGSPTRPARTIGSAIQRARASLSTPFPRPHVFVAGGTYTETIEVAEGVLVHGGYRRDFRALDPAEFLVEVRAPANTSAPGGAVLVASNVGAAPTLVEGLTLRGLDAASAETATLGAYLERPQANLVLRNLNIRAGVPGEGSSGIDGPAGSAPMSLASAGQLPRGALESPTHQCIVAAGNLVRGGAGGQNTCGGIDVSGGTGGQAACPAAARFQGSGDSGRAASGGVAGGRGGQDAEGPIRGPSGGCPGAVCCGLADFTVPSDFQGPTAGLNGAAGGIGNAGNGCADPRGSFRAGLWGGGRGSAGASGQPGGGGSGGGAGGGVEMRFVDGQCEWVDGLGGGGGGGGAGGCGGGAGLEGTSGAPSVALLVVEAGPFTLDGVVLQPSRGGRGGPGGAGGDGGLGGVGEVGGQLAPEQRNTPTLAGTYNGARGGSGGAGGPGGGGGGGCGGASVGVWVVGNEPTNLASWRMQNRFALGSGGDGGPGGGGAQVGSSGARGEALDVVVQR